MAQEKQDISKTKSDECNACLWLNASMHAEGCHADPVKMLKFKELITLASSRVNTRQCHSETKWCHYGASFKP